MLERARQAVPHGPAGRLGRPASSEVGGPAGSAQNGREVERGGPPIRGEVAPRFADHLADLAGPDGGELGPESFSQRQREPLDLLRRSGELRPEVLPLGGDPGRAGVEVALAGHVAADRHEHRGPERELLGAEERGHQ